MAVRRWELVSGGSAKFWEIGRDGSVVTVRFGRLGAAGQTQTKELASAEAAEAHVAKLVAEKEKKGYQSVSAPAVTAPEPEQPAAVLADEDTWVMPSAWLKDAVRRRDLEPAPRFVLDTSRAQEFRDWVAAMGAEIAEAMANPRSNQTLVRVLQDQLDGRPSPLGAALLASVAQLPKASVHWWIAEYGLPFAAAAVVHCSTVFVGGFHNSQTGRTFKVYLESFDDRHPDPTDVDGWNLIQVRNALAVADSATHDAAVAELEKVGATEFGQVARAFLVPARHDWFEEANAHAPRRPGNWMTLCAVSTLEQLARLQGRTLTWSPLAMHTALHVLGPAIAPFIAGEIDAAQLDPDERKFALKVLASLPTDEAFTLLLDRKDTPYVRPVLLSAMAAFPSRAARILAPRAPSDHETLHLLRAHLTSHPDLEVTADTAALLAEAGSRLVPEAPASALPRVLAQAPWSHPRPQPKPVVLKDVPVPAAHVTWLPGEREEWLASGSDWTTSLTYWEHAAEEVRTGRHGDRRLFENGPEELARPLLAGWVPGDGWGGESWGRRIAARFELDALPPMLRLAASNPHVSGVLLLPYASAEVAELMANWLVRLKTARTFAVAWLARHGEAAARLLLPSALGAASPQRRYAELALRHLHLEAGVDVIAVATSLSTAAGAAIRTLIEVDPVDVLPAKLPAIGEWADTRLLPQVLLADRTSALSAEAATNLLMTAALSKPDAVYAGLPIAVEACDRESLAEFAWEVFRRWQAEEAPPKDGWALTALGWFGNDETVRRLAPLIRAWPGENAHAKAVTGLDVLAQIGSETALAHLNGIAEKVKFKALKARAQEKVADIAATLGLSRDQLSDRLIPTLGLDDAASLVIDYGPRQFTVGFDEQLKPFVLDPDGKRRKDLPKPAAKDDQDKAPLEHQRFAALKKDVRTIAADQIQRLERAMIAQRTWTADEFHAVLAAHPLLWHLVRRLVWITDDGLSFRLAEDRTLANAADDEITLPANTTIRLAHPVDLADTLATWGEVFADYEILQPFPQLGRPAHAFAPGEPRIPQLHKYLDLPVPVGRILGLTKRGWVRGTPQDAGVEEWITRPLPSGGALVATLDPGIAVGAIDVFPEVKFTSLWFSETGEGHWTAPRDGGPDSFDADPVTASELLAELESLHA
ncbi:putative DNA-binding WGR domain protein [Lentzea atacamensis]|uniref:Putative DNA-binding WGR domain protein n=1 Tax=Lentzea atacamensis TaxID=531938 RepID=A0A316HQV1_9PSEU|nr:DUF4132 domain-containing protein [Lentzea atacamensis]PWK82796.1 putative DNA-binding WGR domain protein [Lentzea atacamensis]